MHGFILLKGQVTSGQLLEPKGLGLYTPYTFQLKKIQTYVAEMTVI